MPPERRPHLFERRTQPEPRDHLAGMGLGLAAGRRIVELQGGLLEAEFPLDGGTRFILTLPTAPRREEVSPRQASASAAGLILIVDDDASIRGLVSMALSGEGYEVREADHGRAALEIIERIEPTLILLDMRMPIMDGWAFAQAYHERPGVHAPIVAFTAAQDAAARAEQIGAEGYLSKPFELDELLTVVGRHARQ